MAEKKAILVVSFGTSFKETREKNITAIERDIAAAYSDWQIHRAFTSGMILKTLKKRDNIHIDNVDEAVAKLVAEGVTKVFVQPTHILNGDEYDKMVDQVLPYADKFSWLKIGQPLLSTSEDYEEVCRGMAESVGKIKDEEALILMGHGTGHFADAAYAALDYRFKTLGYTNIFVATVEGYPELSHIMPQIAAYGPKKIKLLPLMVVAGDHASNDMAGGDEDSWKTQLEAEGYEVECFLKGMGEISAIRQLYLEHISREMNE